MIFVLQHCCLFLDSKIQSLYGTLYQRKHTSWLLNSSGVILIEKSLFVSVKGMGETVQMLYPLLLIDVQSSIFVQTYVFMFDVERKNKKKETMKRKEW